MLKLHPQGTELQAGEWSLDELAREGVRLEVVAHLVDTPAAEPVLLESAAALVAVGPAAGRAIRSGIPPSP